MFEARLCSGKIPSRSDRERDWRGLVAETQAHEHGPGTTQGNRETLNLYLVTVADLWGGGGGGGEDNSVLFRQRKN